MLRTNHEWVQAILTHTTGVLSAQVDQVRAVSICPVLVVDPVALRVRAIVLEVEVINQVVESLQLEIVHIDVGEVTLISVKGLNYDASVSGQYNLSNFVHI